MRFFAFRFFVVAVALPACGGRVVVDGLAGEDGAGGTRGASSSALAASSKSSVSVSSVSSVSSTSSAASSSSGSGGIGVTCGGAPFGGIGAACNVGGETFCQIPFFCCKAEAQCKDGVWELNSMSCDIPNDCAPPCIPGFLGDCKAGTVCVKYIGDITAYQCRPNPCAGALNCSCAGAYCKEQGMTCETVEASNRVLCH